MWALLRARLRQWTLKLQCPIDENAGYENTTWCNRDLIPVPTDRRMWTWEGFAGWWIMLGVNTSAWAFGSSLLALGLSVKQSMGLVVAAALVTGAMTIITGWPGSHQYVGFTVLSRSSWGMRGSYWPVLNRILSACIWMGIQLYWGGQATRVMIASIWPSFATMRNTLPQSANVKTNDLIAFFVFTIAFLPTLLIRPEKLQRPFLISFAMIFSTFLGILIWALVSAHGAGTLFKEPPKVTDKVLSWNIIYGLQYSIGSYVSAVLGQSDWTRYAKTPNAALFGQAVTAPLAITLTTLCGILVTSASASLYGEYLWNPLELLFRAQQTWTPAARAGTFFAGLGIVASQMMLCIALNAMSGGMDMATLAPKYLNIRRGTFILTAIGVAVCPWNYVNNASTFITVMSGWGVFLSPMTGILVVDYFVVRKRQLHVADLYRGDATSVYWYTAGVNTHAVVAWCLGVGPLLPGFVREVKGIATDEGWDHLYKMAYFVGFFISMAVHGILSVVFPAPGQGSASDWDMVGEKRSEAGTGLWDAGGDRTNGEDGKTV